MAVEAAAKKAMAAGIREVEVYLKGPGIRAGRGFEILESRRDENVLDCRRDTCAS